MQPTSQKSPPQISPEQTCGQEDSRVRIFRSLAASEGLTEQEVDSFLHLLNSSKAKVLKIDPHGLSLKMLRISYPFMEDGTLRPFSIRWPHSAITEPTPPQESALKGNKRMSWRTWLGGSLFGISALIIFVLWRLSVRFPISGMTGNGVHLTGFSGFLGFHGILHESYVIVAIGIIGLILLITDFIRIKKNNR